MSKTIPIVWVLVRKTDGALFPRSDSTPRLFPSRRYARAFKRSLEQELIGKAMWQVARADVYAHWEKPIRLFEKKVKGVVKETALTREMRRFKTLYKKPLCLCGCDSRESAIKSGMATLHAKRFDALTPTEKGYRILEVALSRGEIVQLSSINQNCVPVSWTVVPSINRNFHPDRYRIRSTHKGSSAYQKRLDALFKASRTNPGPRAKLKRV